MPYDGIEVADVGHKAGVGVAYPIFLLFFHFFCEVGISWAVGREHKHKENQTLWSKDGGEGGRKEYEQ